MEKCTTHDFSRKKNNCIECMEQKSIKNYEFLLSVVFFLLLSCAIGVSSRNEVHCRRRERKKISVKTVRINLRGLSSFARPHAVVLETPQTFLHPKESLKSPTTFHSSMHLRCWCKVQSWTYRIPLPKHLNGAEISFFFNFLLFVFS